jgi:putative hemolysin
LQAGCIRTARREPRSGSKDCFQCHHCLEKGYADTHRTRRNQKTISSHKFWHPINSLLVSYEVNNRTESKQCLFLANGSFRIPKQRIAFPLRSSYCELRGYRICYKRHKNGSMRVWFEYEINVCIHMCV